MIHRLLAQDAAAATPAGCDSPRSRPSARKIPLVMPNYTVKEIFFTLQGEGFHTGTPAVFCRFAGCNLWTGREAHRSIATCQFCDTDFVGTDGPGGGKFTSADDLATAVGRAWSSAD